VSRRGQHWVQDCLFINNLGDGIECLLNRLAEDTKLGGVGGIPKCCAAVQKDLNRLERQPDRNHLKLNKGKLFLPLHHYKMGNDFLERSSAEKNLGFLVDSRLALSQQCALVAKKATVVSWRVLGRVGQGR